MSQEKTSEQTAREALARLTASVQRTTPQKQGAELRDQQLRSLDIYKTPRRSETSMTSSPASTTLMEKLWVMMAGLYGHRWVSAFGESDVKFEDDGKTLRPDSGIWAKALSGITGQQIAMGMRLCTLRTGEDAAWPPSAPEFRAMCEQGQSNLGIPTADAAWREAVEASTDPTIWKFSHPIVQEAGRRTDWYAIRHGIPKAVSVQNRFNKHYTDLTAKLQRGEPVVDGQLAIAQELRQGEMDIADAKAELELKNRMIKQGVAGKTPEQLRAEMLEKLRIKR